MKQKCWRTRLAAVRHVVSAAAALLVGCAEHDSFLARDPLTAIFTKTYIAQLPAPIESTRYYQDNVAAVRARLEGSIAKVHGQVVLSAADPEIVTFYVNYAALVTNEAVPEPRSFVEKLRAGRQPLMAYVWSRFSEKIKQTLASAGDNDLAAMRAAITDGLNEIITGPSIYDPKLFAGVSLREDTRNCLGQPAAFETTSKCNRLLIEDALLDDVKKTTLFTLRPAFTRFYVTVLLAPRYTGAGAELHSATWRNAAQDVAIDYSSKLALLMAQEEKQ